MNTSECETCKDEKNRFKVCKICRLSGMEREMLQSIPNSEEAFQRLKELRNVTTLEAKMREVILPILEGYSLETLRTAVYLASGEKEWSRVEPGGSSKETLFRFMQLRFESSCLEQLLKLRDFKELGIMASADALVYFKECVWAGGQEQFLESLVG